MFVVYKLFFETSDKFYIGKTYNINKRILDHIYSVNTLKERTKKANWMRKHLKLGKIKFEILYSTDNEAECYAKELEIIKSLTQEGANLVNTQRMVEAGGRSGYFRILSDEDKIKRTKQFGIPHVLIREDGEIFEVNCLKEFSDNNGLKYKNLHSCVKGKSKSSQGYKVFYKKDWDSNCLEEKLSIVEEFKVYNKNKTPSKLAYADSKKKEFWILNKNGYIESGFGVTEYCKSKGYNGGNIINTHRLRRPMYGKILFYDYEDLLKFKKFEFYKFYTVLDKNDIDYIVNRMKDTKKFSRDRGKVTKELSNKYNSSFRRISDIFKNNYTK